MPLKLLTKFSIFLFLCDITLLGTEPDKEDLSTIIKYAQDSTYRFYFRRRGAIRKLANINNTKAVTTLVELLDDPDPAIQDEAVHSLRKIKSEDFQKLIAFNGCLKARGKLQKINAIRVVSTFELESIKNILVKALSTSTDTDIIQKILQALDNFELSNNDLGVVEKYLKSSDPEVKSHALNLLGKYEKISPETLKNTFFKDNSWQVKNKAFELLCRQDKKYCEELASVFLKETSYQSKICFLRTLEKHNQNLARKYAEKFLNDTNWKVQAVAIDVFKNIGKFSDIEILIHKLKSSQPRIYSDIIKALKYITGKDFGFSYNKWHKYLLDYKELKSNEVSEEEIYKTISSYYALPVLGSNIVFIIDMSGSMIMEVENNKGRRKINLAIKELSETLNNLSDLVNFNIIIMSTEAKRQGVRYFSKSLVRCDKPNVKKALEFVNQAYEKLGKLKRGRGDFFDSVMEAMEFKNVDSIYILSDGVPTAGKYIYPESILEALKDINKYEVISINTILTGTRGINEKFLKQLSSENFGEFTVEK